MPDHEILRKRLRRLKACGGLARTENFQTGILKGIDHASGECVVRADHREVDGIGLGKGQEARDILGGNGDIIADARSARIARSNEDFFHAGGLAEFPSQRVLSAA